MSKPLRLSAGAVRALLIAAGLVVVALVLVVIGWPEQYTWQSSLLQLSWLVFDAAVFVVIWHLVQSRNLLPPRGERFRLCWFMLLGGGALGLLIYLIALISQHAMLAPLGQLCIAIGLGAMACYLAATSLSTTTHAEVENVPELADLMRNADDDVDAPLADLVGPRRAADED